MALRRRRLAFSPNFDLIEPRIALSMAGAAVFSPDGANPNRSVRPTIERDVVYGRAEGRPLRLDVYGPSEPAGGGEARPVILAIHGGGWRRMSKESYGRAASMFTASGFVVVAIDYRLSAPGRPSWPGVFDDARAAARWIRDQADARGVDPDRIVAMGESAGGHLAAMLGAVSRNEANSADVSAVVDFYGPADLVALGRRSRIGGSAVRQLLGASPELIPDLARAASPVDRIGPGSAPMLIIQGLSDPIVPAEQSRALARSLTAAGVKNRLILVPGATHGFRFLSDGRNFATEIIAFLQSCWNDDG